MITGELKNKVDKLWEMFWTGGLTNPLDVIEQITYLMFIRDLDEMDNTRKKDSVMLSLSYESIFVEKEPLKWSSIRDKPADSMYQIMQGEIFPFIKTLHTNNGSTYSKYMEDAIFKIPTPRLLEQIITVFDELYTLLDKQPDRIVPLDDNYSYDVEINKNFGVNFGANFGVNATQQKIIELMIANPYIKAQEIADKTDITKRSVEYAIRALKKENIIERTGAAKNGKWIVLE